MRWVRHGHASMAGGRRRPGGVRVPRVSNRSPTPSDEPMRAADVDPVSRRVLHSRSNRAVAQLVAYTSGGRGVGGSSPPSPTFSGCRSAAGKFALRAAMRQRLRGLPADRFAAAGRALVVALAARREWQRVRCLLGFAATGREPATAPALAAALAAGVVVGLPRVVATHLRFHRVADLSGLRSGYRGVAEPPASAPPLELDGLPPATLVLVPGARVRPRRRSPRMGRRALWTGRWPSSAAGVRVRCWWACACPSNWWRRYRAWRMTWPSTWSWPAPVTARCNSMRRRNLTRVVGCWPSR